MTAEQTSADDVSVLIVRFGGVSSRYSSDAFQPENSTQMSRRPDYMNLTPPAGFVHSVLSTLTQPSELCTPRILGAKDCHHGVWDVRVPRRRITSWNRCILFLDLPLFCSLLIITVILSNQALVGNNSDTAPSSAKAHHERHGIVLV